MQGLFEPNHTEICSVVSDKKREKLTLLPDASIFDGSE